MKHIVVCRTPLTVPDICRFARYQSYLKEMSLHIFSIWGSKSRYRNTMCCALCHVFFDICINPSFLLPAYKPAAWFLTFVFTASVAGRPLSDYCCWLKPVAQLYRQVCAKARSDQTSSPLLDLSHWLHLVVNLMRSLSELKEVRLFRRTV